MSDPVGSHVPGLPSSRKATVPRLSWIGFGLGLASGVTLTASEAVIKGYDLAQVALPGYLVLFPLVGLGLGWLAARSPEPMSWHRSTDFFADGPVGPARTAEWAHRIRRFTGVGFLLGMVLAFTSGLLNFLWRGWPNLVTDLVVGLVYFPVLGSMIGYNLGLRRGDPPPSIRNLRFGLRGMLLLVAYCGLLFGVVTFFDRNSRSAMQFLSRANTSRSMIQTFEQISEKQRSDLVRAERAQALRQGRIPDGLLPIQTKFLRSLDAPGTDPDYRKQRFDLIADGEETAGRLARQNLDGYARLVDYHRALEAKYRAALKRPWLAVEPDPPPP